MKYEEKTQLGARVPRSLHKRLKIYCINHDREVQDVVTEALTAYLDKADKKTP